MCSAPGNNFKTNPQFVGRSFSGCLLLVNAVLISLIHKNIIISTNVVLTKVQHYNGVDKTSDCHFQTIWELNLFSLDKQGKNNIFLFGWSAKSIVLKSDRQNADNQPTNTTL